MNIWLVLSTFTNLNLRSPLCKLAPSGQSISLSVLNSRIMRNRIPIQRHFENDHTLLLDGGTGEELFKRGVPDDRKIWSATAVVNKKYHNALREVHNSFLDAGSKAVTTNSYGIVPGVGFSLKEIEKYVAISGQIARDCVNSYNSNTPSHQTKLVLGSLGPLVESYRPDKIMQHNDGVKFYEAIIRALCPFVDIFLAETMSCFNESSQAVEALGNVGKDERLPLMVSYTLNSDGKLRDGELVVKCIDKLLKFSSEQNIQLLAILFNCAEPEAITVAVQEIRSDETINGLLKEKNILLGAYANRLTPIADDWSLEQSESAQPMRTDLSPEEYYIGYIKPWIHDYGLRIVGGCCGITPEHISYIQNHLIHTEKDTGTI